MPRMMRAVLLMFLLSMVPNFASAQEPDIAKLKSELRAQFGSGKYDEALKVADLIVDAVVVKHGKDSVEAARAWADKGTVLAAKGDAKRSLEALDKAADAYEKQKDLSKTDAASYASVLERIGAAKMQTDILAAENVFKRALQLRETAHGPDSPETAVGHAALANVRFWQREYKDAAYYFGHALEIIAKNPKANRDDLTLIYHRARCSLRKAKLDDAAEGLKMQYADAAEFASLGGSPDAPRTPRSINAGVVNGKAISLVKPRFPAEARADNAEGTVKVDVLIDEKGDVVSACASPNVHAALGEASEVASYASKFSPTKLAGNPVKVTGVITYNFRRY